MNTNVHPCEDFYTFVCGNYPTVNPVPDYYNAISAIDRRINEINDKIAGLIRQQGFEILKAELKLVDLHISPPFATHVEPTFDPIKTLAKIHKYTVSVNFLFDVSVQLDPKEMKYNRIFFGTTPATSQASINSNIESSYNFQKFSNVLHQETETDKRKYNDIREGMRNYMTKVVLYMYQQSNIEVTPNMRPLIEIRVQEVINFLLEVEKTRKINKYSRVENIYYTSVHKLQAWTDNLPNCNGIKMIWINYFMTLYENLHDPKTGFVNKQDQKVIIEKFDQFRRVMEILCNTTKEVLVSAMWWVVVQSLAWVGPNYLQDFRNEYLRAVYNVEPMPRKIKCLNLIRTNFGFFVGYVLAKDERSYRNREKVINMVNQVKISMGETIRQAEWMDANTKAAATTKLDGITAYISYWNTLRDPALLERLYGHSVIVLRSFYDTYGSMLRRRREEILRNVFNLNNFDEKLYPQSQTIMPRYYPNFIHLNVPLGTLGFPFYDLGAEALNYGALASLIGHEIWYAFDKSGKNYDRYGNGNIWWSDWSTLQYSNREKCFIEFYNNINFPELQRNVDGLYTAMENIADFVGFEVGLKAFEKFLEQNKKQKKLVKFKHLTPQQLYTIAFGNMYCMNASYDYINGQLSEDESPPKRTKVNKMLINSKEFTKIWDCQSSMPMNPENKCYIFP